MRIIETRIDPYEFNRQERRGLPKDEDALSIKNHWSNNRMVVLEHKGVSITISADELQRAISNATNWSH